MANHFSALLSGKERLTLKSTHQFLYKNESLEEFHDLKEDGIQKRMKCVYL